MDAYASVGMPVNYRHWSLRQGVHRQREELPARPDGPGLRDRHQLRSLHRLPDGGEHDGDAGARDRPRRLRPQQLLQGQLPVPHSGPTRRRSSTTSSTRRNYIAECEERYGIRRSRNCSTPATRCRTTASTATTGRARSRSPRSRRGARSARPIAQSQVNDLWRTLPQARRARPAEADERKRFPSEPQENLLYFIEKNAPLLEPWQREVVRIVRKIAQYFYPQRQTQVMNEGWATFWHYTLLNTLYDEGHARRRLDDRVAEVAHQRGLPAAGRPPRLQRHQSVRARLRDVHRHPAHLREPDRRGPRLVPRTSPAATGCTTLHYAMRNFKDESFIAQYLSPQADPRLAPVRDPRRRARRSSSTSRRSTTTRATARCARRCRGSTTSASREPNIQVWSVNLRGDRVADAAPHAAQQPAAARRRAGSAQARRAAVGLRRAPGKRRPVGRRHRATGRSPLRRTPPP